MSRDMLKEFREIKILTRVRLVGFNPLNAELNPICHLLALLGAHPILYVSRIKVNCNSCITMHGLKQRKILTSFWP
jgi:hypothetical protein